MDVVWEFFTEYGRLIVFLIGAAGAIFTIYGIVAGIIPSLVRLGKSLSSRKIAVLASGENQSAIINLLSDARFIRKKLLIGINGVRELERAADAGLLIVEWSDWHNDIDTILALKKPRTALIVYARPGSVPPAVLTLLDSKRNTLITNFRGRLLNDVFVSMVTTGYEKN
jgi:hypothetical protein